MKNSLVEYVTSNLDVFEMAEEWLQHESGFFYPDVMDDPRIHLYFIENNAKGHSNGRGKKHFISSFEEYREIVGPVLDSM
mgnify:CR=1 FL=1